MNCVQLLPSIRCREDSLPNLILLEGGHRLLQDGGPEHSREKIEAITIARRVASTRLGMMTTGWVDPMHRPRYLNKLLSAFTFTSAKHGHTFINTCRNIVVLVIVGTV